MYIKMVKQNNTKRISQNIIAAIGAVIVLIGGFFLSYNYIQAKKLQAYDYMANAFYDGTEIKIVEEEENNPEQEALPEEVSNEYIGYLNIPKINLTKGFLMMLPTWPKPVLLLENNFFMNPP